MKNIRNFHLKVFIFSVVKFSIYLNRRVFVMKSVMLINFFLLKICFIPNNGWADYVNFSCGY